MSCRSRGHNKRTQSIRGAPEAASAIAAHRTRPATRRDRAITLYSQPMTPIASQAAPPAATEGGAAAAAAAAADAAAEPPSEARKCERAASSCAAP